MNKSKQIQHSLMLFAAAMIWGLAFVAQTEGMNHIGPFTFTFARNIIGAAVLLPLAVISRERSESNKVLVCSASICGIALGLASCLQQYGMLYTTPGKAGFLTALYIIIIPIAGIFLKKKCHRLTWTAAAAALFGIYLLCMTESFALGKGDIFEILCAFVFSAQIMIISHFSGRVNVYRFACIEFFTSGLFAAVPMLLCETVTLSGMTAAWLPLLYTGILSSGVAYTLQIIGQRGLNPTLAALIMSLESCFSVISGWIILGQSLSFRELAGCIIMFAAIVLAQLKN